MDKLKGRMKSFDEIFEEPASSAGAIMIRLDRLVDFKGHPYRVVRDAAMEELIQSIRDNGVIDPLIVRALPDGNYEKVSGHRRAFAAEAAGLEEVPCYIRELDDDTAAVLMVDSNLHRETILPSEKAKAYKVKYEALKHQGKAGGNSLEKISDEAGESVKQVQRYLRLNHLNKKLLDAVDDERLGFAASVELSYLKSSNQEVCSQLFEEKNKYPTTEQAKAIRELPADDFVFSLLELFEKKKAPSDARKITIPPITVRRIFPEQYTKEDIDAIINELLLDWAKKNGTLDEEE